MINRSTVSLGTWSLLTVIFLSIITVTGNYPRTPDSRLGVWFMVLLACAAGGYTAGRVSTAANEESLAQRLTLSVISGIIISVIVAMLEYSIMLVLLVVALANSHFTF